MVGEFLQMAPKSALRVAAPADASMAQVDTAVAPTLVMTFIDHNSGVYAKCSIVPKCAVVAKRFLRTLFAYKINMPSHMYLSLLK